MALAEGAIPTLAVTGSFAQVAHAVGSTFSARIRHACADALESLRLTPAGMTSRIAPARAAVERHFPQLAQYLEQMAEAADVPADLLFYLNSGGMPPPERSAAGPFTRLLAEVDGCTSVASRGSGHVVVCHSEDSDPSALHDLYLLDATVTEPHAATNARRSRFVALSYVYTLPGISASMNEHGVVQAVDALPEVGDRPDGVPCDFLSRALLDVRDLEQAIELIARTPARGGASYVLAQADRIVGVEVTAAGFARAKPAEVLCHTNHFVDPTLGALDNPPTSNSRKRFARAKTLARPHMDVEDAKILLQDRFGFPESICRERTIAAFVADTRAARVEVCSGEPASGTWSVHPL